MHDLKSGDWVAPDGVFDGGGILPHMALRIQDGRTGALIPRKDVPQSERVVPLSGLVTPGFVDLQINGGGGVLLNHAPTTDAMAAIAAAHRRFGTVAILPTLITDAPDVLPRVASAALAAAGQHGIRGLHIEGPHISVARRGTHAARFVRPMDDATLNIVADLRRAGIAVMITIAPEATSIAQTAQLSATGAVVSLGHSDADAETTRAYIAAGACCFTHLFNAMSPLSTRAPGMIGAALNAPCYAGMICDGVHVDDTLVAMALRARPVPDTTFLVSDAMPTVGGPDQFELYGKTLQLKDGRLINSDGALAGAHTTMAQSVARVVNVLGQPPGQALRMAVTIPARVIGQDHLATVAGRDVSDILVLDDKMAVRATLANSLGATA